MSLFLKNSKRLILAIFLFGTCANLHAQKLADYKWKKEMSIPSIPDSLQEEPQVYFLKHQKIEFIFDNKEFFEIEVLHEKFWVNSDEAIDRNNKVYLPMNQGVEIISTKARVQNPNGKLTKLNKEDIKEITDENENTAYYYALKGIEKGSFIEYFYVIKKSPGYTGTRKVAQETAPVLNYQFDLISPKHLIFSTKSYNGFGVLQEDGFDENYNHLIKRIDFIPAFIAEDQAYDFPNRMSIIYKLDENTASGGSNIISYKNVGDNIITAYNSLQNKSDEKGYSKMIKEANIGSALSDLEKLQDLELYYKTNFSIASSSSPDLSALDFVYKNKISSATGFMKFMAASCRALNIEYQFVITSNRKRYAFDQNFESYNFLRKYLMYFPREEVYMNMEDKFERVGLVDPNFQDNYGVFFKPVYIGQIASSTYSINWINAPLADASMSEMDMTIKVSEDFSTLNFDLKYATSGYNASPVQPYFGLIDKEAEKKLKEDLIKWVDPDMELLQVEAENTGYINVGIKPLILNGKFNIDKYIIPVREKYLIKLGLFIGPQAEMYQDGKPRTLPVDMGFRKNYHRVMKFEIPENYKVTNLESINMEVLAKEKDGEVYADFISSFSLENDVLTITCDERYHKIHFPVEQYEDYRKVINAAADFNKIVIYLEEK